MRKKNLAMLLITILQLVVFSTMAYVLYVVENEYGEGPLIICGLIFLFGMCTMAAIYELHSVFKIWKTLY